LFQTDSLKQTKAVEIARQSLSVAKYSVQEVQARYDQVRAQYELDQSDLERFEKLVKKGVATEHEMESQSSKFLQSEASVKHAAASVDLAKAQLRLAQSNLTIAQKNLTDTLVVAPISGCVSTRYLEPGERADPGTPVLRIDDLTVVEITGFLPEQHYSRVLVGKTKARLHVDGNDLGEVVLSFRGPVVSRNLRTFEIKAVLDPAPAGVVPGRMANLTVIFDRQEQLGVPEEAVVIRGGKQVLFAVDDGKARKVPVKLGLRSDGMVAVTGPGLAEGQDVAVKGQRFCEENSALKIVQESR
jgi:multidrug efflux pump subunit AcrA (membrane-fusion protein)